MAEISEDQIVVITEPESAKIATVRDSVAITLSETEFGTYIGGIERVVVLQELHEAYQVSIGEVYAPPPTEVAPSDVAIAYSVDGLISEVEVGANTLTFEYDGEGVLQAIEGELYRREFEFDGEGRITAVTVAAV
jgi:YD repeat-containing protein